MKEAKLVLKDHDANNPTLTSGADEEEKHEEFKSCSIDVESEDDIASHIRSSDVDIYLLTNPLSGSQEGKNYTQLESNLYRFTLDDNLKVILNIVDITVKVPKNLIKLSIESIDRRSHPHDDKPIFHQEK